MSEIIPIHLGGAGCKIGLEFWKQIRKEHNLDSGEQPVGNLGLFTETMNGSYQNKGLFIDTDPRLQDLITMHKPAIRPESVLTGKFSCRNLFAEGRYVEGETVMDEFVDRIRKKVQVCDCFSGFFFTHSLGGGVGSGAGATALSRLRENYPQYIVECYQVLPGTEGNYEALAVYNTVMANHLTIEYSDFVVCMQNEKIHERIFRQGNLHSTLNDVNKEISSAMNQLTIPYRFGGWLNTNQRKRATNMLLFPRIKFLTPSLTFPDDQNYLTSAIDPKNSLIYKITNSEKRIFNMNVNVRCDPFATEQWINGKVRQKFQLLNNEFIEWIPHPIHASITEEKGTNNSSKASVLLNSPQSIEWLKKTCEEFTKLFRRKAYVHHYVGLGMDEMQFTEAESNANDLLSEYIPWGTDINQDISFDEYPEQQ